MSKYDLKSYIEPVLTVTFALGVVTALFYMVYWAGSAMLAQNREADRVRNVTEYTATCPGVEFKFKRIVSGGVMYNVRSDGVRINSIPDVCVITSRRTDQ